jgi:hypothetical protein
MLERGRNITKPHHILSVAHVAFPTPAIIHDWMVYGQEGVEPIP